jgi:hypothetical protein
VNSEGFDRPEWYEIGVQGRLDERWSTLFEGMALTTEPPGSTVLRGRVVDQTALHGLLARLRDLGLPLVWVRRISAPSGTTSSEEPAP